MNTGISDIIFNTLFCDSFTFQDLSAALAENGIYVSAEEIEEEFERRL